ncbi:MAG TPA: type VI secretion system tube protein Hcp [Planctomycetota bacterium]|nr:type VI secretion system tube protein Hcp [Planctomycetota bacterium]
MGYTTYLKIDGIAGECTEQAHHGWMAIDSFSHSVCAPPPRGGPVNMTDLSICKFADRTMPLLARAAAEGRMFQFATIELCQTDARKSKFMEIRLSQVRVTMHSLSGSPQGDVRTPYENLTLGFDKIEWFYYPGAFETGSGKADEVRAGWCTESAMAIN